MRAFSFGDTVSIGQKAAIVIFICSLFPIQALAGGLDYSAGFVPEAPEGFQTISGQDFDIRYGAASQGDVGAVADAASNAYATVEDFFHNVPFHPEIIVASTQGQYEDILNSGPLPNYSMSSGWGDGGRSAVVIKQPELVPDFQTAMTHEMTHIATRSYIQGYKYSLPDWFSEGLAVYVSGDLPEAKMPMIEGQCRNGELMSIDELDKIHRLSSTDEATPDQVSTAYMQAGLLSEYIADKYGNGSLLRILDRFGPVSDLNEAFVAVIGETPEQVNQDWQSGMKAELDRRDGKILEQTVYGYIVDQHGTPMSNETVSFTALRNDSVVYGTAYKAMTNETGQYSVKVTYGSLSVESEKPEYAGFNDTISLVRNQSLFLNVTLNGTALEERIAREKAETERRSMIYLELGALTVVAAGAVLGVFVRSRKR